MREAHHGPPWRSLGVTCVELSAEIGGWRRARDRLGVPALIGAIAESNRWLRLPCRRAWPGSVERTAVLSMGRSELEELRRAAMRAIAVTRWGCLVTSVGRRRCSWNSGGPELAVPGVHIHDGTLSDGGECLARMGHFIAWLGISELETR